jgi:hypothetical protein
MCAAGDKPARLRGHRADGVDQADILALFAELEIGCR